MGDQYDSFSAGFEVPQNSVMEESMTNMGVNYEWRADDDVSMEENKDEEKDGTYQH